MGRTGPPILECWPQFSGAQVAGPGQGQVTGCASRVLPGHSRFLFTSRPAPGDGSLVALSGGCSGPSGPGSQGETTQQTSRAGPPSSPLEAPHSLHTRTHLSLLLSPLQVSEPSPTRGTRGPGSPSPAGTPSLPDAAPVDPTRSGVPGATPCPPPPTLWSKENKGPKESFFFSFFLIFFSWSVGPKAAFLPLFSQMRYVLWVC